MEGTEPRTGRAAPVDEAADPKWAGAEEEPSGLSMGLAVGQWDWFGAVEPAVEEGDDSVPGGRMAGGYQPSANDDGNS